MVISDAPALAKAARNGAGTETRPFRSTLLMWVPEKTNIAPGPLCPLYAQVPHWPDPSTHGWSGMGRYGISWDYMGVNGISQYYKGEETVFGVIVTATGPTNPRSRHPDHHKIV